MKRFAEFIKESSGFPLRKLMNKYTDEFYVSFFEKFPNKKSFDEKLFDYIDYDPDLTDDENMDENWYPEAEVNMLESELDGDYPGAEQWTNFYNELGNTNWYEEV